MCWSITASRCRAGSLAVGPVEREPRTVLPSTASTRRRPGGARAAHTLLDEPADDGVEPVGVDVPHDPADRRLARAARRGARACSATVRAGRRPTRRSRRTSAPRRRPRTPPLVNTTTRPWRTPRALAWIAHLRQRRPQARVRRRPDRAAPPRPPGRRGQRWTRMQTRARLSSDDRAWCENRQITTRAVPAPRTSTACRRSSAPTHRDFADPLPGHLTAGLLLCVGALVFALLAWVVVIAQRWTTDACRRESVGR